MNIADLRAQLESNQSWRKEEILFFQNCGARLDSPSLTEQFYRAIILLLYAHLEGYCKFAFTIYIKAINDQRVPCTDVVNSIAAISLSKVFHALRNTDKKCREFKNALPDDSKLHSFSRDVDFVENFNIFYSRTVSIPDDAIDLESNLSPDVLRKTLFQLGLPHQSFDSFSGTIYKLLHLRNKIAHGQELGGIKQATYYESRDTVFKVMDEITVFIFNALRNNHFLKTTDQPTAELSYTSD